ncbi:MAG: Fic family protein [Gemmatimonadaceae bacterium]|nr:Fic family protein [Gemmatimonadaceae bacterium]
MTSAPERIVARNLYHVVSLLVPATVISHRTAIENRPAEDGSVFVSAPYERRLALPGTVIRLVEGPGPLAGDRPLMGVHLASRARALLECLKPSRARSGVARGLPRSRIEEELERDLRGGGPDALNRLRDEARELAPALDAAHEFDVLHDIIGGLLHTRPVRLTAPVALARAAGMPYDPDRLQLFQSLLGSLRALPARAMAESTQSTEAFMNCAFFDAYFSNYIEGTKFKVEEAQDIVFHGVLPTARPKDAHDVLGTYRVVSSDEFMRRSVVDDTTDQFLERLRAAHRHIMGGRPEERPGEWKTAENMAGTTVFVHPDLVEGTLRKGVEIVRALDTPFHRAVAMMFVLSEVHPFGDGNGRVSRAFMNAEVLAAGKPRILVPIIVRDEYITGLRLMTRESHIQTLVDVLSFGQRLTTAVEFSSYDEALIALRAANALEEPRPGVRARIPQ